MRVVGRGGGIVAPTSRGHVRQLYGCGEVIRDAVARPLFVSACSFNCNCSLYNTNKSST